MLLESSMSMLLMVNVLIAVVVLAIGIALGAWFFRGDGTSSAAAQPSKSDEHELRRVAERVAMASMQVDDIAKNMLCDVEFHSGRVDEINSDLQAIASDQNGEQAEAVFATIGRMMIANSELQRRLAKAKKQIAGQAAELRGHESEARTDSVTNLANRRAFDDEMQRCFAEWQRHRTPFSLIILDLDNFKKINDTYGHQAGDEMLRKIGQVLAKTTRQTDLLCRYGGEEFSVILPGAEIQDAYTNAERYRKAVEAASTRFEGRSLSVTVSVGVARIGDTDNDARLIRRADEALYKSKEAGRNCSHWHDGVECNSAANLPAKPPQTDTPSGAMGTIRTVTKSKFVASLHERVTESHRYGVPLSLLHLQIDDFRGIQEKFGAPVADKVFDVVALHTQSMVREIDILVRFDDGAMVALLPGSTLKEANQLAKRWRIQFAACELPTPVLKTDVHVSQRVVELRPDETAATLLARSKSTATAEDSQKQRS